MSAKLITYKSASRNQSRVLTLHLLCSCHTAAPKPNGPAPCPQQRGASTAALLHKCEGFQAEPKPHLPPGLLLSSLSHCSFLFLGTGGCSISAASGSASFSSRPIHSPITRGLSRGVLKPVVSCRGTINTHRNAALLVLNHAQNYWLRQYQGTVRNPYRGLQNTPNQHGPMKRCQERVAHPKASNPLYFLLSKSNCRNLGITLKN